MRIIIGFLLLFLPALVNAQAPYNLPPKSFYRTANVTLKDFSKYECRNVHIQSDSIYFTNTKSRSSESLALSDIDYIRVKEGNQALKWSGLGALCMGLITALNTTEYSTSGDTGTLIAGFTISGAAIGGLIGLTVPKWKTYYLSY